MATVRRAAHAVLLLGIIALSGYYQSGLMGRMTQLRPDEPYGMFYTEAAFHYRYFLRVSQGRGVPALDTDIQHPEGFRPFVHETPVMEHLLGALHLWLFRFVEPHRFVIQFALWCAVPGILLAFAGGRIVWGSPAAGHLAAAFYALSLATFSRSLTSLFLREQLALPLLFAGFVCWLWSLRRDGMPAALLGAAATIAALAAWHVSHLYLSVFVGAIAVFHLSGRELPRRAFAILAGGLAVASVALPVLRAKHYFLSPPLMLVYALLLCRWRLPAVLDRRGRLRSAAVLFAFAAAGFLAQRTLGDDTHVLDLMIGKLRFLGELPDDSRRLSFEAKSMWTGPFLSPSGRDVLYYFWSLNLLGPLSVGWIALRARRGEAADAERWTALFAVVFYGLFLLTVRLHVFAIFFMVLPLGALATLPGRATRLAARAACGAGLLFQCYFLGRHRIDPARPPLEPTSELLSYLQTATPADSVILSGYEMGPSIALYSERAVVLHSKFESTPLRDKVESFYRALYGREEDLAAFGRRHRARYFVYQTYMALQLRKGGAAYTADALPLQTSSAPFRLHFAPESLRLFALCFQNAQFRVFALDGAPCERRLEYLPIYDLYTFRGDAGPAEVFENADAARGLARLRDPGVHKELADRLYSRGDYAAAAAQYRNAVHAGHDPFALLPDYSRALDKLHRFQTLSAYVRALREARPDFAFDAVAADNATYWLALADVAFQDGDPARAVEYAGKALRREPDSELGHLLRGAAHATRREYEKARVDFEAALRINPGSPEARKNLARLRQVEGERR